MDFAIQAYTVRDRMTTDEDVKATLKALKEMGYEEVQTAGHEEVIADCYKDAGLKICGTHYNWDNIVNDVEGTVALHKKLGTDTVGIGGMPRDARESLEGVEKFITLFNETAKKYKEYGFKLSYHNHSFEFRKFDGVTIMDRLIEGFTEDNIRFVLDTYWVQHGGADVRAMIERLAGKIDILHLKDMAACGGEKHNEPYIVDVGSGNIDFKTIIPLAKKCGVTHFCVEQDGNYEIDSMTSAKKCIDYLKANIK